MRRVRGQAAVELALGMIVLTTILLFGIHFGEMGYLGAKIHEASAAALWDSTAYETHNVTVWYNSQPNAVAAVTETATGKSATSRYTDFDGRSSHNGSAPRLAMVQASPIALNCIKDGAYGLPAPSPFAEPGGISCSAQADLAVVNIATSVLDRSNGFFGEDQVRRRAYTLCSTGRFKGGCGRIKMLLGDDALHDGSDPREKGECSLTNSGGATCSDNPHFYTAAKMVFDSTRPYTGIPERWASGIIPNVPWTVTGFYMSFRGDTSPYGQFMEKVPSSGAVWETNPHLVTLPNGQPYLQAYLARGSCAGGAGGYCYLGKFDCN
jgi:hypothetical protein